MKIAGTEDYPRIESILSMDGESMFQPGIDFRTQKGFYILDDYAVFWCNPIDERTLEVHTTFTPDHRGRYARDLTRVGQRMIFSELSVERLVTKCKLHHKYVVAFAQWMGFKQIGTIDDTIILECPIEAYVMLDNDLSDFAIDIDFPLPMDCSQVQSNFAGFVISCLRSGMLMKGIQTYNRMAVLMNWEPLLLTSTNPILLTIGDRQFSPSSMATEA
jgi:hypothetical protein